MRFTKLFSLFVSLIVLLVALPLSTFTTHADSVILTLVVPEYMSDVFKPELFTNFETDHPGVKVVIKTIAPNLIYYPPAYFEVEKHLDNASKYVAAGDVLYINSYNLSVEATRAGLFLNLLPLVNADKKAVADDFIPAAWQSYQWDQGMWALPASVDVMLLMYDPESFDKAGLAYPTDHWTLDDLAIAARSLAKKDNTGKITQPALIYTNLNALFRSATSEPFYDVGMQPNPPQLDKPSVIHMLETWAKLEDEGVVGSMGPNDSNETPIRIDMSYRLIGIPGSDRKVLRGALLPGGKAGMSADGFAISGATQYPDQAYALLQYLTGQVDAVSRFFGVAPARKSLVGAESGAGVPHAIRNFTPENQAIIDTALVNALPVSELRFTDYLWIALQNIRDKKMDAQTALQNVQAQAVKTLQTASERRGTKVLAVATPIPTPVLQKDQVLLKFNMVARYSPLPNREQWDQVIKEFTNSDPQVKQIVFETTFGTTVKNMPAQYDCFYVPYTSLSADDVSHVLNLDPLLNADPKFDKNDFVGGVLTQLQRDNKTWGYPLEIMPQALLYDSARFTKASVPSPGNSWSIHNFADALKMLKATAPSDPVFAASNFGSMHLLMLIAAYGGLPMDYRTDPLTVNFTDPANVDAIRQVLDLAKKGYIKYDKLLGVAKTAGIR